MPAKYDVMNQKSEEAPQDPIDKRAPDYDNNASGWVRGAKSGKPSMFNEDATTKPGFDRQGPTSKMRR